MLDSDIENEDEKVMKFDFTLNFNSLGRNTNFMKRHEDIGKEIELPDDEDIKYIFNVVSSLCDPFTQPEENDSVILSVYCLSDVLITLSYMRMSTELEQDDSLSEIVKEADVRSIKFTLSLKFFSLLRCIQHELRADDEIRLRYVKNDQHNWRQQMDKWTPRESIAKEEFSLKLCFSMSCVLLLSIFRLFASDNTCENNNLALNPYLQYFIKLWKCHTNILLLGLEADRLALENADDTPFIVRQVLKGSSSIRYVLAWILNQNPSLLLYRTGYTQDMDEEEKEFAGYYDGNYDLTKESVLDFVHPVMRRIKNGGSLLIDMRLVIAALLIINCGISFTAGQNRIKDVDSVDAGTERLLNQAKPIVELNDLLIDLEYDDQFDEDILYIFECELDDFEEEGLLDHDKGNDEQSSEETELTNEKGVPTAFRVKDETDVDFDSNGNDWRDVPRESNASYQGWFMELLQDYDNSPILAQKESENFFYLWTELEDCFKFLISSQIENDTDVEKKLGQVLINTIAKSIRDECANKFSLSDNEITPDRIYHFWSMAASNEDTRNAQENNNLIVPILRVTNFELLLHNNSKISRCMMDEMLMCPGYRRVLIWFITHNLNLSTMLIDYVYELLVGLRGNSERQKPYKFTRVGQSLVLSDIEKLMLLHEFLTSSSMYLSSTEGIEIDDEYKIVLSETIAKKYMTLICLMINQLINIGIIDLTKKAQHRDSNDVDIYDYTNDLQVLLINWVGKLPEARELFFKTKRMSYGVAGNDNSDGLEATESSESFRQNLISKYSEMSSFEISDDLSKNSKNSQLLANYASSLHNHISVLILAQFKSQKLKHIAGLSLDQVCRDFLFFLDNFNTLSKIDLFAEELFNKIENLITINEHDGKE